MKSKKLSLIVITVLVMVMVFTACTKAQKDAVLDDLSKPTTTHKATDAKPTEEEAMKDTETAQPMVFNGDAFNFELMDVKGDTYKLSELQGKKVYVKFWATWCSICLAGMGEFSELNDSYQDNDDVLILTVVAPGTSGEMQADQFKDWFTGQGYSFKALLDDGDPVMREYGIRGFPTSVFISTTGNVSETMIGHVANDVVVSTLAETP